MDEARTSRASEEKCQATPFFRWISYDAGLDAPPVTAGHITRNLAPEMCQPA